MIAGRVAATRFLNRPTSVWHCMRDVILYGVGTASAFGLILAPFKLLDMLFRRAHSTNRFIWSLSTRGMMLIPFEVEAGIAFVVYYQFNNVRNADFAKIFHYMVFVYAAAVVASLYAIQRTITWILEHIHKVFYFLFFVFFIVVEPPPHFPPRRGQCGPLLMRASFQMTCYVAGIACCDFMTASKLTFEYAPCPTQSCVSFAKATSLSSLQKKFSVTALSCLQPNISKYLVIRVSHTAAGILAPSIPSESTPIRLLQ
jgi:hypothetical protein